MTTPLQTDPEHLLEKWRPLIRAAAWRWAEAAGRPGDHEDLVQEAALAVWQCLKKEPGAPATYLRQVAEHAARDSLCRGRSIDRPLIQGERGGPRRWNPWALESLEALQEEEKPDKGFVVRSRRDGDLPDPTTELALARLMCWELQARLTPRQRQVLELRLQEYNQQEIAACLGLRPVRVHYILEGIQARAMTMWEGPQFGTCAECGAAFPDGNNRCYCSNVCKCRAYRKRKKRKTRPK